ncbi:trace amine-associated receptor 13c-like [Salarias fasciatus]|uniref:trace amine-associated receptor 13c-like n=1 Tax=Salarias fasciatus TaxID=181472 RepID=UPI001176A234|nr:trace amine-associated receptor 13c-like [Salarias fasciatus]
MESELLCFPQLLNASCRRPPPPRSESRLRLLLVLLLQASLYFICGLTVALNLLVVVCISYFRRLHSPTNTLLLSLAVADLLVGLLSMPGEVVRRWSCWPLGDAACCLYNFLSYVVTSASVGNMVLISADRHAAVCDPLRYPGRVTPRRARLAVLLCWLCSLLYGAVFVREEFVDPGRHHSCQGECVVVLDFLSGVLDLVLTFVLPVAVIVLLYLRVFAVAASQARALRSRVAARRPQAHAKRSELKAARTLGVLVLVFLLCFCPFYCVSLALGESLSSDAQFFVFFLFYFNSSVNPLIYALFYPWFRKAVRHTLTLRILQPGSSQTNFL